MLRLIAHLAAGTTVALWVVVLSRLGRRPSWLPSVVRRWHRNLCDILGVRIRVHGRMDPDCLQIGNHISWLDIPVVGSQGEIGFLSKADVRGWPLIGWLAEVAGTHFIERGANRIPELSEALRRDIAQGQTLMIFPEGTTTDGRSVMRFHPRLFALALETGCKIQPVALGYRRAGDGKSDAIAPFIGDDTLVAHLMRVIHHPDLVADVRFLPPLDITEGTSRRVLAETSRHSIVVALGMDPAADPARRDPSAASASPAAKPPECIPTKGVANVA
jgi:1-acyl-sn-glycerol-3-phosphate acyltransferase